MDSINLNQQNVTALKNRFDLVTRMGRDMLTNGSEIFRTKQAMHIAARRMGLEEFEVYLLTNGIFATMSLEGKLYSSRVFQVPLSPIMLNRVDELNALSRRIGEGACSPEEVSQELDRIEAIPMPAPGVQVFGAGIGSLGFCYLFRGTVADSFVALTAGLLLWAFVLWVLRDVIPSKPMRTSAAAFFVAFLVCLMYRLGWGDSLDSIMIGAIFPLVPGASVYYMAYALVTGMDMTALERGLDCIKLALAIGVGIGFGYCLPAKMFGWRKIAEVWNEKS